MPGRKSRDTLSVPLTRKEVRARRSDAVSDSRSRELIKQIDTPPLSQFSQIIQCVLLTVRVSRHIARFGAPGSLSARRLGLPFEIHRNPP